MDSANPLSLDHFRMIEEGRRRSRRVLKASRFAAFSASTLALFAVISGVIALFGDIPSLIVGIALGVSAFFEFRGARLLAQLDPRGPALLGWNQLALGGVLVIYSIWMLVTAQSSPLATMGSTGDPQMDASIKSLTSLFGVLIYGTLAVVAVVAPGLTALYYFTRTRLIRDMLANTPDWVIKTLRSAA